MNRETKRLMKKQGQVDDNGTPVAGRPQPKVPNQGGPKRRRSPFRWLKEVRAELRKVAWPTREEVRRYSQIVLVTLLLLMAIIFGLDYLFSQAAIFLFR